MRDGSTLVRDMKSNDHGKQLNRDNNCLLSLNSRKSRKHRFLIVFAQIGQRKQSEMF